MRESEHFFDILGDDVGCLSQTDELEHKILDLCPKSLQLGDGKP